MPWWTGPLEDWWYSLTRGRRQARAHYARVAFVRVAAARGEARAMLERQSQKWYLHPDAPQGRPGAEEKLERTLRR